MRTTAPVPISGPCHVAGWTLTCLLLLCGWHAEYVRAAADSPVVRPADAPTLYNPEAVNEWYDKTDFNLLVDYYTEIPGRPYGTGITPENLRGALQMCRPGYIIFYAKGHSGTTAFKSRLGTEHPMLGEDPLRVVRQVTRECGVKMILYYSGLIDGAAAERHPEWRPAGGDGKRQAGPVKDIPYRMAPLCANSRYFDEWVATHLKEIIRRYDPDGIWIDGCWEFFSCYCDECRKAAAARFGSTDAVGKPEFQAWARDHFRRRFAALVRRLKPSCLVSFGNTTPVVNYGLTNYMDYQSGDWFSPSNHRYSQSLAMRRYTTLGVPYEAMTCDTAYSMALPTRSLPKTLDRMLQEGAGVLINGGKWIYWTYPMPNGALIPSRMRLARACRDWVAEREDLWHGTQSARWTAVVENGPDIVDFARRCQNAHPTPSLAGHHPRRATERTDPLPASGARRRHGTEPPAGGHAGTVRPWRRHVVERRLDGAKPGHGAASGHRGGQRESAADEGHVLLADGSPACLPCDWAEVRPTSAEDMVEALQVVGSR